MLKANRKEIINIRQIKYRIEMNKQKKSMKLSVDSFKKV